MSKILITGGAGFIGYHLASRLVFLGHKVVLVDNFSRAIRDKSLRSLISNNNVEIVDKDLLDDNALNSLDKDFEVIFHLAAIIGVSHVMEKPYNVLKHNATMLANAIEFAKLQDNLHRFLFASTSEVYAGTLKFFGMNIPTPEETPLAITESTHPRTSYMLSKIYGEAMCHHSGLPFVIFRPHNVYGPRMGMSHVIPELCKKAILLSYGEDLEIHSADHSRTFCFIDDAVEQLRLMMFANRCKNQIFNLGNESQEIKIAELAKLILQIVDRNDIQLRFLPGAQGSPQRRCPDMRKSIEGIEYSSKVNLDAGIRKTFDWYRDNIFSGNEETAY